MTAPFVLSQAIVRTARALRRATRWLQDHPRIITAAIVLLALVLRLYRLADKNIWWDEGSSAWQAPMSLAEITLYQARDQHPPLYYWLLHGWYLAMGPSLFSLRLFSVLWGIVGVAIAYALGRRLLGQRQAAWMGSFLLAISRFHIEWSQEIKMYAMVSALSMLSLLLAVELARAAAHERDESAGAAKEAKSQRERRKWLALWAAYVATTALAAYTHYVAFLVVAAQNIALVMWFLSSRRRRRWGRLLFYWAASQGVVAACVLPWFLLHAEHSVTWAPSAPQPFAEMVRMVATLLAVGTSLHVERYTAQTLVLWVVAILSACPLGYAVLRHADPPSCEDARPGVALLWTALIAPWLLTYLLTLPIFRLGYESKLAARFFLLCQTPFSLLLGAGLSVGARRWPWSPWAGLVGVVLLLAWPLHSYYDGRYLRDDYGTLTDTIEAYGQPGEAILLMNDSEWPLFRYEYGGSLPVYQVPYGAVGGGALIAPYIKPAWDQNDGLWVVTIAQALEQDPGREVGAWLQGAGQRVLQESYGERSLALYRKDVRPLTVADTYRPRVVLQATPAQGLFLEGYDQPLAEVRTGRSLRLATTWRILGEAEPVRLRAGLIDRQGRWVGPISEPARLGADVPANTRQRLRTDIPISTAVGSGAYTVRLALETMQGAPLGAADLGAVRVIRTMGGEATVAENAADYRLGQAIVLQGYDLRRSAVRAGDSLELALYWKATANADGEYTVFVHIVGDSINPRTGNPLWGQVDSLPMGGKYPTSSWRAGDAVVDRYSVTVDPQAPAGRYDLEIGLYTASTGKRLPVTDGNGQALGDHIILAQVTVR